MTRGLLYNESGFDSSIKPPDSGPTCADFWEDLASQPYAKDHSIHELKAQGIPLETFFHGTGT